MILGLSTPVTVAFTLIVAPGTASTFCLSNTIFFSTGFSVGVGLGLGVGNSDGVGVGVGLGLGLVVGVGEGEAQQGFSESRVENRK